MLANMPMICRTVFNSPSYISKKGSLSKAVLKGSYFRHLKGYFQKKVPDKPEFIRLLKTESQGNHTLKVKNAFLNSTAPLPNNNDIFRIQKRWKDMGCPTAVTAPTCQAVKTPIGSLSDTLHPDIPRPKVVIIGAGMAGLSAAYRLSQAGINNFQVLEARDRIGGRVLSCLVGDVVAELGSLFICGAAISNPLYSLAAQEDLLGEPLAWRDPPNPSTTPFLATDGRAIEPAIVCAGARLFSQINEEAMAVYGRDTGKVQGSLKDFFKRRMADEEKAIPADWKEDISRVYWSFVHNLTNQFGVDASQVSCDMYGSYILSVLPGKSLRIPLGLMGIFGPLLKGIDEKCIATCKPVESITWQGGRSRAVVKLKGDKELNADYVLVTIPLGVLKECSEKMFTPCLPEAKQNALEKVGVGHFNRFVFRYERPFWLPREGYYNFTWSPKEFEEETSWIKGLTWMEELPGTYNILHFTLGGEESFMSESCSDDDIAENVTKALRRFSGDPCLPYPTGVVRSKWGREEYSRGGLTFLPCGATNEDICELGRPVPGTDQCGHPVLLFAGESTAPGYVGSLLGAHLSGIREADRIIQLTRKFSGPPPH